MNVVNNMEGSYRVPIPTRRTTKTTQKNKSTNPRNTSLTTQPVEKPSSSLTSGDSFFAMIGGGTPGSSEVPIALPQSRFNHRFERTTVDVEPIELLEGTDVDQVATDNRAICGICKKNQARYTCPRSQTPYCSVECYRQLPSSSTEAFYESRAQSILKLEAKEREEDTLRILNRQYQQQQQEGLPNDDDEDVDMDELKELLSLLMTMNEEQDGIDTTTNTKHSLEKLMSSMSPTLRAAFERDLQNGNIQKLVLREWHPWWRREFGNGMIEGKDETVDDNIAINAVAPTKTLDERLLDIPIFSQLSKKRNPQLLFHVLDIVYSYSWTLRLYHGLSNILATNSSTENFKDSPAAEAAATFLSHSRVLHQQTTYQYSSIEEVLIQCTAASTGAKAECNTHWNVLVQDCSLIFSTRRFVGRALIETIDMIQAAIKYYKKQRKEQKLQHHECNEKDYVNQIETQVQDLRKVRKKLEYLIAWSKQSSELEGNGINGNDVSKQIEEWGHHWQDSNEGDEELHELQIPSERKGKSKSEARPSSPANPLMTVVETRPK